MTRRNHLLLALMAWSIVSGTMLGQDALTAIPVVNTRGELANAPVVAEGPFGRVRVGIEALRASRFSGVLVYGLVELAPDSQVPERFQHDEVLGPLDCRVFQTGDPRTIRSMVKIQAESFPKNTKSLLYTRAVVIDQVGEFVVAISHRDSNKELAQATVVGTDESFHAWSPLSRPEVVQELQERDDDSDDYFAQLSAHPSTVALPSHSGFIPMAWPTDDSSQANEQPLPKLNPETPASSLTLRGDANELVIESTVEMVVSRPDRHFLARWWVNGKPFFVSRAVESRAEGSGLIAVGKRIRVGLDFDSTKFGAVKGDRIGLQLLHLPHGWQQVGTLESFLAVADDGPDVSRLTNRIEFIAP